MTSPNVEYGRKAIGVRVGADVAEELDVLWQLAGRPPSRTIAEAAGCSHSVVAEAISGRRMPSLKTLLRIVEALDGDGQYFMDLYKGEDPSPRSATSRDLLASILQELQEIRRLMGERA